MLLDMYMMDEGTPTEVTAPPVEVPVVEEVKAPTANELKRELSKEISTKVKSSGS